MILNKFKIYTYKVNGLPIAATSQKNNFNPAKIKMAIKQSLSLWTAYAALQFQESSAAETDFTITFIKQNDQTIEIGVTIFLTSIEMNVTNRLFIDKFNEPENPPATYLGPWDFIRALTHEIGHVLELDHPPLDPNTNMELYHDALMSRSFGEKQVVRTLTQYDIDSVQQKHGSLKLEAPITPSLQANAQINISFTGLHFIKGDWGIQLDGPVGNALSLYVFIPESKGKKLSSIELNFNTYTANTLVRTVEAYDGIIPIQEYYISDGISKYADSGFKQWHFTCGILEKNKLKTGLFLKINIEFRNVVSTHDVGVFQLLSVKLTSLHELFRADFPDIKKLKMQG
ncbi:MAG: matrixin family metalloprotease [Ferruginibacter sp.]